MRTISAYYELTKPDIVYGNLLVAAAGFVYGGAIVNWLVLVWMLVGLACVVGSACVFNNIWDRDIDAKMPRTKTRPSVSGEVSAHAMLVYGVVLGVLGLLLLYWGTTADALLIALVGFVVYVGVYTPLKHRTAHALWVGAVAGATPPVVGYAAATSMLDANAFWLFVFLFVWQVPHFLGIAAYRYDEYHAAGIPLLIAQPSARGKKIGRYVFFASLAVLLVWCAALMLHK